MSKIYENCPYFKVGKCNNINCLYIHHKPCKHKLECNDSECKFGHIVSIEKRLIINEICDNLYLSNWKDSDENERCNFPMNCSNVNCGLYHIVEKKHRINICKIMETSSDEEANILYEKLYNYDILIEDTKKIEYISEIEVINESEIDSPKSSVISNVSTVEIKPKMVDIVKNTINSELDTSKLSKLEIMNMMMEKIQENDKKKAELNELINLKLLKEEKIKNNNKNIKKLMETLAGLLN